ncbi:hypothetical protein COOONC_08833 [Cooperia oncophora]
MRGKSTTCLFSDTLPCDTSTARRKCRVDQSDAPGTCSVDDSITEYCAYKCNCTYPVDGVPNQCGTSPSQLQYATWWETVADNVTVTVIQNMEKLVVDYLAIIRDKDTDDSYSMLQDEQKCEEIQI